MPVYKKDAGAWKQAKKIWKKDAGVWKLVKAEWRKDAGVWKKAHQSVYDITISVNTTYFVLTTALTALGWNGTDPVTANVTINAGIIVNSNAGGNAFTTGTLPAGSTVNLTIEAGAYIIGRGGNGGAGSSGAGGAGAGGSHALRTTVPMTITNYGNIWAGGGGGGGGGGLYWETRDAEGVLTGSGYYQGGGGGGGRGSPNSSGGTGSPAGTAGTISAPGAGGVSSGGNGGAGGGAGANGANGVTATYAGGAGGLAGFAVNAYSLVTWNVMGSVLGRTTG